MKRALVSSRVFDHIHLLIDLMSPLIDRAYLVRSRINQVYILKSEAEVLAILT